VTSTPSGTATSLPATAGATPSPVFTATPSREAFQITVDKVYPNPCNPEFYDLIFSIIVNKNSRSYSVKIFTEGFRMIRNISINETQAAGKNNLTVNRAVLTALSNGVYYYTISAASDDGFTAISKPGNIIILRK